MKLTIEVDADDERAIREATARYQRRSFWPDGGGTLVPEGDSELLGAILGEICRDWMENHEIKENPK